MASAGEAQTAHHEWAMKMWSRMDRDGNGAMTREELDCEDFRAVLKLVLAPQNSEHAGGGGPTYARAQMNTDQCLDFCLRKADVNRDERLSFHEFKCFMWGLRQQGSGCSTANLVFALFDLDGDNHICEQEFHEIYRYYLGHIPKFLDFSAEWNNLCEDQAEVSIERYAEWIRTTANPVFCQRAPPPMNDDEQIGATVITRGDQRGFAATSPDFSNMSFAEQHRRSRRIPKNAAGWPIGTRMDIYDRPKWNPKYNAEINPNDHRPMGQRNYFSRSQTLPQLRHYYSTNKGFELLNKKIDGPEPPKKMRVLSTDTACCPLYSSSSTDKSEVFNWRRHAPGGTMREHVMGSPCGEEGLWEDRWQTPMRYKSRFRASDRPIGSHALFEASHQHMGPMAARLNRLYG